jgi:ubiquinone/menaquinone biosynthesis C-methylase UbiE
MTTYKNRKDNHDYMSADHVASFLRNHNTGTNNLGRHRLAAIIREHSNPTVLDVACGTCVNWEVIKSVGVECQYTGLDRTKKMLAHAKDLYGGEIKLQEGFIQSIPFQDGAFDVVIARHILEHLGEGYEAAIKEVYRVASKEAIVILFVDLADTPNDVIKESEPDENGCTYFWNTYAHDKFMTFLGTLGCQVKTDYIQTPGAAASDTIFRLIK